MDKMLGYKASRTMRRSTLYEYTDGLSRNAIRPVKSSVRHQEDREWRMEQEA